MKKQLQLISLLVGLFISQQVYGECGVERQKVKTLQDRTASKIVFTPVVSTVTQLASLPAPKPPKTTRLLSEEQVYSLDVMVLGYKHESDGDYHVVIASPTNTKLTMIAEIPDPKCAPAKYADNFKSLRAFFGKGKTQMTWFAPPIHVRMDGVLFFDFIHGQTGVAHNGVELHPVLKIVKE